MKLKFKQQRNGDWRWRVTGRNNRVIGASSEGFTTLGKAKANYTMLTNGPAVEDAEVEKHKNVVK